jgi:hypothetical protein
MIRPRHRQMTSTLTRTLQAKAADAQVSPADTPFDPTRQLTLVNDDALEPHAESPDRGDEVGAGPVSPRPAGLWPSWRRRLLPVVAGACTVLVAGALALMGAGRGDDGRTRTAETTTSTPSPDRSASGAPDGLLLPGWVPEGMQLWSAEWYVSGAQVGHTYQLFGDPDAGGAVLVWLQPQSNPLPAGEPTRVRGRPAVVESRTDDPWPTTRALSWSENGSSITASFRGMSTDDAIAALDGLRWRSSSYEEGFADPGDRSLPLQGETAPGAGGAMLAATFHYSDGLPATSVWEGRRFLDISTSIPSGEGGSRLVDLQESFYGERRALSEPVVSVEQTIAIRTWADGRHGLVDSQGSVSDEAALRRVAEDLRSGTSDDFDRLRAEATAQRARLPLVSSAGLPTGVLEVRGEGGFTALCLTVVAHEPTCGMGPATRGPVLSVVVDGVWYVAAASTSGEPSVQAALPGTGGLAAPSDVVDAANRQAGSDAGPYPGETAADGPWKFVLVRPPAAVEAVTAGFEGIGQTFERPGRARR